jgi:hypothetical protein
VLCERETDTKDEPLKANFNAARRVSDTQFFARLHFTFSKELRCASKLTAAILNVYYIICYIIIFM